MPVVRWNFYDPVAAETYVFEVNPNEGGSPAREKNLTDMATSAPDGKLLVFEGRDNPRTMEFSGVLLYQSQLNAFETWFAKRRQVRLTDDLGRQFWIYIRTFNPTRRRSYQYPWKHNYSVSAVVLDI